MPLLLTYRRFPFRHLFLTGPFRREASISITADGCMRWPPILVSSCLFCLYVNPICLYVTLYLTCTCCYSLIILFMFIQDEQREIRL